MYFTCRGLDPSLVVRLSTWARVVPLLFQLVLVTSWGPQVLEQGVLGEWGRDSLYLGALVTSLCLSTTAAGLLTTSCFTIMMALSR